MKRTTLTRMQECLMAGLLIGIGAASSTAVAALNAQLIVRPLTPQEIKDYSLTGKQGASGLSTVGVGQPAYLEAEVDLAVPAADIVSVTWAITNQPIGSVAVLEASPLGTNVPVYKMVDQLTHRVASRKMLRPDKAGQYSVTATIVSGANGTQTVMQTITAGTYMGVKTCALCHSGGIVADNIVAPWSKTGHATFLTRAIDGLESDHYASYCISCHAVGYDANTNAVNGGFDDVAKQVGWTFPTVLTNGNWAKMPTTLQNLGNIQCENCHGAGSEHAFSLGQTDKISVSFEAGNCAQCHDSKPNHIRNAEWNNSRHAIAVEETESGCARCHSAKGFADYTSGAPATATPYDVIGCAACHDPHDATNPHQLRGMAAVTLMDKKTTISTNMAGNGIMCMNCHMSRRDGTNYVEVTAGSNRYGPHHGPQTDMYVGANAMNYGKNIPSSAHRDVLEDSCATCHMQSVASTNAAYLHAGGHSFSMSYDTGSNTVQVLDACVQCHGPMTSFDFKRQDYDGNGVIEGVQTEVKGLLTKLAYLLTGQIITNHTATSIAITSSWSKPKLRAAYNYLFAVEDGSFGIHNLSYAVGILKASIADLTGDANNDGLPDAWQTQYFGSAGAMNASPNATPAGDGVPNWLKYALGLNPFVAGVVVPDGVVWANGKPEGKDGDPIRIYTAAEVVFNTAAGKSYQLQGISSLGGGWQNIGSPIPGDGSTRSFLTPTRKNTQQFFRVVAQ